MQSTYLSRTHLAAAGTLFAFSRASLGVCLCLSLYRICSSSGSICACLKRRMKGGNKSPVSGRWAWKMFNTTKVWNKSIRKQYYKILTMGYHILNHSLHGLHPLYFIKKLIKQLYKFGFHGSVHHVDCSKWNQRGAVQKVFCFTLVIQTRLQIQLPTHIHRTLSQN